MATQPSAHCEDRDLLRRRAWEQRIQGTSQTKERHAENVPLFAEPYKTNKGDELSDRIQRMLGSYEDVNDPAPFSLEAGLPIPSYVSLSQSNQNQPVSNQSSKNRDLHMSSESQKATFRSGYSSIASISSPKRQEHSSRFSATSSTHNQFSHSGHCKKESEVFSDLMGVISRSQEMFAPSPDEKPLPVSPSCDPDVDMDTRDTFKRDQLQVPPDISPGLASSLTVCPLSSRLSPIHPPPAQPKTNTLPSQTFPSLLSSKQAGIVMTQKPTAYVRPMDGQDQVFHKSPELKPSPEHYAPLPEPISKTDFAKTNLMPKFLGATSDEVLCVEEILRDMTHPWPHLLSAIHSPTYEPSKSPILAKEAEQASSSPEQKKNEFPDNNLSNFDHRTTNSYEATHSGDAEMTGSSDSESSLESDSDVSIKEPLNPSESKQVKLESYTQASHRGWQLGEWIRPCQQNSSADAKIPRQTSADATEETKSLSQQRAITDNLAVSQQGGEGLQDDSISQNSKKCLSDGVSNCSSSRKRLKPSAASCPDPDETALCVKSEEATIKEKTEQGFTENSKVKTKTGDYKKDGNDAKKDATRSKHTKQHKKAGSEVTPVLHGHCPSYGVRYPNPCSCQALSPAQPVEPSPASPIRVSGPKMDTGTRVPHKSASKQSRQACQASQGTWDNYQPPKSLLVKVDLSLLSRVTLKSSNDKGISSNAKRPALVIEKDEASRESSKAHKTGKSSKKSRNVKMETKSPPKKNLKLENKNASLNLASVKVESCSKQGKKQKKAKKTSQDPSASKDATKASKVPNPCSATIPETSKENAKGKDSHKNKKIKGKHPQSSIRKKVKAAKNSLDVASTSQPKREAERNRSFLRFDKRQYPVNHYIKEAKKLKHKADAEQDKLSKAFTYLEAAMYFVESGIAMEKDPQISMSSYTMFAETVELLKFVLKLKNPVESSAAPSEKDFLALCLKCQSLLHMAMFRHKQKTAMKFSKTLTDHFHSFAQVSRKQLLSKIAECQSPSMPSPASTSSGPSSNQSGSGIAAAVNTVVIPQDIEQVAFSYVSITTLFLSAHDIWEQAEELALKGSGVFAELDAAMGPLSLISRMSFMVRYIRQGVNWLRLDSQKL